MAGDAPLLTGDRSGRAAAFGLRWHEFDPGFWFIRMLQFAGLAWNVKTPTIAVIARRATLSNAT